MSSVHRHATINFSRKGASIARQLEEVAVDIEREAAADPHRLGHVAAGWAREIRRLAESLDPERATK